MPTVQQCLAMAAEAERLAALVTYTRDKVRLTEQARAWRERAAALEAQPTSIPDGAARERQPRCWTSRLHRRRA